MITEEGKAGRKIGERWSAVLISSRAASNNYSSVAPDQVLALAVPYWYRGVLARLDANFDQAAAPVELQGVDPIGFVQGTNAPYTLQSTATTDLGGGIIRTHVELLGHLRPGSARGDASRRHAGGVQWCYAGPGRAVQHDQEQDHFHCPADRDHDPLPDVGFCAGWITCPQELLQPAAVRSPLRTALISRYSRSKVKYTFISCFLTSPPPILSASARTMMWDSQILEIREGGRGV